jgi:hypothetical protein
MTRSFVGESVLADGSLGMALAPALTPGGIAATPSFLHGFAVHPQVLARGPVTLAEVAATRYPNRPSCWRPTPPLWTLPRFDRGEVTPEALTRLAASL